MARRRVTASLPFCGPGEARGAFVLPTVLAEPAELVDDLVEPLAPDELHGVIGYLAVPAHLEHWHDVGVVQPRRRLRLAAEPLRRPSRPPREWPGRDLQRHPPAQADLLGLVHDAHAASADLADDPVVAQPPLLQ